MWVYLIYCGFHTCASVCVCYVLQTSFIKAETHTHTHSHSSTLFCCRKEKEMFKSYYYLFCNSVWVLFYLGECVGGGGCTCGIEFICCCRHCLLQSNTKRVLSHWGIEQTSRQILIFGARYIISLSKLLFLVVLCMCVVVMLLFWCLFGISWGFAVLFLIFWCFFFFGKI